MKILTVRLDSRLCTAAWSSTRANFRLPVCGRLLVLLGAHVSEQGMKGTIIIHVRRKVATLSTMSLFSNKPLVLYFHPAPFIIFKSAAAIRSSIVNFSFALASGGIRDRIHLDVRR